MAWIELHQEFRDHPKVARLASVLKVPYSQVQIYLVNLWLWACAYARNGDLSQFSDDEILEACRATGEAREFKKAMLETHWIDKKGEKILIHDWKKHGLRVLEDSRRRQAKARRKKGLEASGVTRPSRDGHALLSIFLSSLSIPSISLSSDAFASAWGEWIKYRSEKKKPVSERGARMQLKFLAAQPNPTACVEQSIRNEWQGLFEEKEIIGHKEKVLPSGPRPRPSKPPNEMMIGCSMCGNDHLASEPCRDLGTNNQSKTTEA
jgi:hypothetical protein